MITFVRFGLGKQEGGGGLGRPGGVGQMGERVRKLVSPPPPLSRLSYLESVLLVIGPVNYKHMCL